MWFQCACSECEALRLSIRRKQEQALMKCLYILKKEKISVLSLWYVYNRKYSTISRYITHILWRGVTNSQRHNTAMQELIKSNKKNRMNNLCSTNLRFGVYHWKLLYTVLELKASTLQKNYCKQLQLMLQLATGQYTGKVLQELGTEKVSPIYSLTI